MKNYGVYHIFCSNNWKDVVLEQIDTLKNSDLMNFIDKLFITIIYKNDEDISFIEKTLSNYNYEIHYKTKNNEFEFPALSCVKNLAKKENCNIFYFHTKGVSITKENMKFYHNSTDINHLLNCVDDWRNYMSYFVIERYKTCLETLKTYDACGVNLSHNPSKHFSGNFWWSKSEYINKLPEIDTVNKNHRWNAEFWIGSANGNLHSFHNNSAGYQQRVPKETYIYN
jgi:hypothetical protein